MGSWGSKPRRRALPRLLAPTALAVAVAVGTLAACSGDDSDGGDQASAGSTTPVTLPIGQVQTFDGLARSHVDHTVDYPQTPPVGGDHAPVWQNCGFYDQPIYNETGVHALEHGAVWITYRPDLAADQIDQIRALTQQPYTLASPWTDSELGAPIVFSAWGAQLALDALPSPAADEFLATYREAATAPEPGAPCTGGYGQTR